MCSCPEGQPVSDSLSYAWVAKHLRPVCILRRGRGEKGGELIRQNIFPSKISSHTLIRLEPDVFIPKMASCPCIVPCTTMCNFPCQWFEPLVSIVTPSM